MDDEDAYGISSSYYNSDATFQHYPEDAPTSSFDDLLNRTAVEPSFEDFGEWTLDRSSELPFRDASEPGLDIFDAGTSGLRGVGPSPQRFSGLQPHSIPWESEFSVAPRNQNSPFYEHQGSHFRSGPARNEHLSHALTRTTQSENVVQGDASDNYSAQDGNGGLREGNPRSSNGIRLRQVSELPDMYRTMFRFGVFNAVQSSCFDTIMKSDENVVVSAPTGSGKTVLFELAIIRMLVNSCGRGAAEKCVYVAPTKALCAERTRDWNEKFGPLGMKCCELTGDTVQPSRSIWGDFKNANIIITTAEKWDSLTRSWSTHSQLLSHIHLFLIDEVHILNETRGSTLEVVVCRMKTRGSAVRFVAVSAMVPNIDDVAHWISSRYSNGGAVAFQFGEEYRPCQLSRFVYGFPRARNQNDFLFAQSLNYRLFSLLQQHSINKPILIFVSTRKGVLSTAEQLMSDYNKAVEDKQKLPWSLPKRIEKKFQHKQLERLAAAGIGAHHAGLELSDKRLVEELFMNRVLRVVVATSTLAVGVNLPAYIVVIKDVRLFQNGVSQEYSDLDIMQMIGRAGRPQFDKEGVALIMCESGLESKYRALGHGQTILESSLHTNLVEHLNSEVALGTIKNLETAKEWIRHSFMFRRFAQNPHRYMSKDEPWTDGLDSMISKSINNLKDAELLTYVEGGTGELRSTEFGEIMSKYYLKQATVTSIMNMSVKTTLRDTLEALAASEEFSELKIRAGDKQVFNKLREHDDIRFKIGRVEKTADKVFLLIQAALGRISLHAPEYKSGESNAMLDSILVFRHTSRIARAMVDIAIAKRNGAQIKHGLELVRNINAKVWEDRPSVLCQIETIGEKSMKVLAEHGITTFEKLRGQDPIRLDLLLNKKQASGHKILFAVRDLPQYSVTIHEQAVARTPETSCKDVDVEVDIQCSVTLEGASATSKAQKSRHYYDMTHILTVTSDLEFIDFRRIPTKALQDPKTFSVTAQLNKPSQSIWVYMSSDAIAGVTVSSQYKPRIDTDRFPVLDTRPMTSMEMVLDGLEGNDDFWNMDLSDDEGPIRDSTLGHAVGDVMKDGNGMTVPSSCWNSDKQAEKERCLAQPVKLRNGKYRCNHPCKDKSSCGHLCCRDGTKKPPLAPRQRDAGSQASSVKGKKRPATVNDSAPGLKSSSLVKAPNQALGASLRQLEVLHRSSGTDSHLGIPDGKRIKLSPISPIDGVQPASGTTSKGRQFDLDPSALKEDDGMSSETSVIDISDSDDFPEPHELVRSSVRSAGEANGSKRSPSRASDYSDPDMDALIRDAHLGSIISTGIDTAKIQNIAASKPIRGTLGNKGREEDCTVGLTTRTETTPSAGTMGLRFRPQRRLDIRAPSRLFYSDSDTGLDAVNSASVDNGCSAKQENSILDKTLFDFLGSEATRDPPATPSHRRSSSPGEMEHLSTLDSEEPSFYSAWKTEQRKKYGEDWNPIPAPACPAAEPEHDHLAEFEEWLATTDSIEFIN